MSQEDIRAPVYMDRSSMALYLVKDSPKLAYVAQRCHNLVGAGQRVAVVVGYPATQVCVSSILAWFGTTVIPSLTISSSQDPIADLIFSPVVD